MNEVEYITMYNTEDAHWWYVSLHDLVLRYVPKDRDRMKILDAGCGTGRLLQLLSAYGTAQGCDSSETALRCCRERGLNNVGKADLNTISLTREQYDVITSIDVLYHADISDERAVLKRLYDALKPGGLLIFQVPAYEWLRSEHDRAVHTRRRYMRSEVVALLRDSGFIMHKATYRVGMLLLPIAMIRLNRRLLRKGAGTPDPVSDITRSPKAVNALLGFVMRIENLLLKWMSLPVGTSVFVVARKPDAIHGRTAGRDRA